LLELMLSLAIIAMLMVAASKYYKNTQTARRVQVAVETIQALYVANERFIQDGMTHTSGKDPIGDLTDNGYLPQKFTDDANPWGGTLIATGTTTLTATFGTVPNNDCNNVSSKLSGKFFVASVACADGNMTVDMSKSL